MLGACFLPSVKSQLVTMCLSTAATSFAFTIQFTYISFTYAPNLYGPLISVSVGIQGVVGLLAYPGLSPNPFGPQAFMQPLLWILLPPTALLLYFPWLQWRLERKGEARALEREWRDASVAEVENIRGTQLSRVESSARLPSFSGFPAASAILVGAWSSNGSTYEC